MHKLKLTWAYLLDRPQARKRPQLRNGMTFKEFNAVLELLGFQGVLLDGKYTVYTEPRSDTLFVIPTYKDADKVSTLHIAAVGKLLSERGLLE